MKTINKINYKKSAMIKLLIERYDYISKLSSIRFLGNYFPETSIVERIDAWKAAY